jgi:hypothetical protein
MEAARRELGRFERDAHAAHAQPVGEVEALLARLKELRE